MVPFSVYQGRRTNSGRNLSLPSGFRVFVPSAFYYPFFFFYSQTKPLSLQRKQERVHGEVGSGLCRGTEAEGEEKGTVRTTHTERVHGARVAHPSPSADQVWHHQSTEQSAFLFFSSRSGCARELPAANMPKRQRTCSTYAGQLCFRCKAWCVSGGLR